MRTLVDKFGRIVIPKTFRDDLGLKPGSEVDIQETPDLELRMRPVQEAPLLVREGSLLVYNGKAVGETRDAVKRARQARDDKFIRRFKGTQ